MSAKWIGVMENEAKEAIGELDDLNLRIYRVSLKAGVSPMEYIKDYKRINNKINSLRNAFDSLVVKMYQDYRLLEMKSEGICEVKE